MSTKLTLSLKDDVIKKAKKYARSKNSSLSVLVENYFRHLTDSGISDTPEISPIVEEISGLVELPDNFDWKKGKAKYLIEKYK